MGVSMKKHATVLADACLSFSSLRKDTSLRSSAYLSASLPDLAEKCWRQLQVRPGAGQVHGLGLLQAFEVVPK